MTIRIRRFEHGDLDALFMVRRDSILNVAARDYSPEQIRVWARDKDDRPAQLDRFLRSTTWVAVGDGRIVGFTNLGADGYLDCMYVHSEFQRRGVASALLQDLEAEARANRIGHLHSNVSITARAFFERRGFIVITPQRITFDGMEYDNFRMGKSL